MRKSQEISYKKERDLDVKDVKKKSKIVSWEPKADDYIVKSDGKVFYVLFDKVLTPKKVSVYNKFMMKKKSYEKQLDIVVKYINFFIKFYDTDNQMVIAYLKIKYAMDHRIFTDNNPEQPIDFIYEVFFTDSIISKINQLVEDNYLDDIESSEESKKYINKERKHLESLEFTNKHIKILLRISFGMKCISPIMLHYTFLNNIKLDKDTDIIYLFYRKLFTIFSDDVNIYNKLYVYVKAKVLESKSHNALIFGQRDILGTDEATLIEQFLHKVFISENIVKYKFNENYNPKTKRYKENIVGFNKTILKYQLLYFLKEQYSKNFAEVTSAKNAEGLSGMDKMEMNLQKNDEGLIILAEVDIRAQSIKIHKKDVDKQN